MKKAIVSLLAIMLVLVLLPSCTTTVGVKTLVPSEVNLGGYKKIAIASTTFNSLDISYPSLMSSFDSILGYYGWGSIYDVYPWQNTGYVPKRGDMGPYENLIPKIPTLVSSNLKSQMENYYTSGTVEAMAPGFYELFDTTATAAIIKAGKRGNTTIRSMLQSQGVDALLTTNVDDMTYEEYITMEKKKDNFGNDLYEYYLIQKAYLRISYKVVDVDNNVILSTENYSKKYENKVKIAHTYKDGTTTKVQSDYNSYSVTKASDIFKELSQGFFSILLKHIM